MIAALADEAVAYALYSLVAPGETINTVEMKINFLAAVKEGEVEAVARITKRGRTISLGEVEVRQGERLVAKAMCTYIHLVRGWGPGPISFAPGSLPHPPQSRPYGSGNSFSKFF